MTFVSTLREQRLRDSLDDGVRVLPATAAQVPSSFRIPLGGNPSIPFTDVRKVQGVVGTKNWKVHEAARGFYAPPVMKRSNAYTDTPKRLPSESVRRDGSHPGNERCSGKTNWYEGVKRVKRWWTMIENRRPSDTDLDSLPHSRTTRTGIVLPFNSVCRRLFSTISP